MTGCQRLYVWVWPVRFCFLTSDTRSRAHRYSSPHTTPWYWIWFSKVGNATPHLQILSECKFVDLPSVLSGEVILVTVKAAAFVPKRRNLCNIQLLNPLELLLTLPGLYSTVSWPLVANPEGLPFGCMSSVISCTFPNVSPAIACPPPLRKQRK